MNNSLTWIKAIKGDDFPNINQWFPGLGRTGLGRDEIYPGIYHQTSPCLNGKQTPLFINRWEFKGHLCITLKNRLHHESCCPPQVFHMPVFLSFFQVTWREWTYKLSDSSSDHAAARVSPGIWTSKGIAGIFRWWISLNPEYIGEYIPIEGWLGRK